MCALCPASLKLWAFLCWLISPQLEAGVRKGERQPRVAAISSWGRRTVLSHGVPLQTGLGADRSSSWKAARTFRRAFSPLPRSTFTFAFTWIWLRAAVQCIYTARCQAQQLRHWEKLSISPGGLCAAKEAEAESPCSWGAALKGLLLSLVLLIRGIRRCHGNTELRKMLFQGLPPRLQS